MTSTRVMNLQTAKDINEFLHSDIEPTTEELYELLNKLEKLDLKELDKICIKHDINYALADKEGKSKTDIKKLKREADCMFVVESEAIETENSIRMIKEWNRLAKGMSEQQHKNK
jgi:hypothetical protein